MKVLYGLVLSLLLSVILSMSKVKPCPKSNGQNLLAALTVMVTINQNIRQSYIHSHCERSPLIYDKQTVVSIVNISVHQNVITLPVTLVFVVVF